MAMAKRRKLFNTYVRIKLGRWTNKTTTIMVNNEYAKLQERIRSRYSIEDEQYFTRISVGALANTYEMQPDEPGLIAEYQAWVEESREIARLERIGLGLS